VVTIRIGIAGLIAVIATIVYYLLFVEIDNYKPSEGDFLFQDLDCGSTCDAIEAVTWGVDSAKFSHIGLVINKDGEWKVLEAISSGVVLTSLDEFLSRSRDANGNPKVWVGRLKEKYVKQVRSFEKFYPDYLGYDYDSQFIYNNGKYYCSELIYDLFKKANGGEPFFDLEPMTFKLLNTDKYFPVWIDYFQKLNISIPQDSLGINPAGISRSEKIQIIYKLGVVGS
jgi:hypothetical protein